MQFAAAPQALFEQGGQRRITRGAPKSSDSLSCSRSALEKAGPTLLSLPAVSTTSPAHGGRMFSLDIGDEMEISAGL